MGSGGPFDPERIFAVLAQHKVDFVLIGALAGRLQGFPRVTADADITPDPDPVNLERLAAALRELNARIYTDTVPEGLPFDCSARALGRASLWNLVTAAGRLDLIFQPAGFAGYAEVRAESLRFELHGAPLHAASLTAILRSKEVANRPQDRHDAVVIRQLLASNARS